MQAGRAYRFRCFGGPGRHCLPSFLCRRAYPLHCSGAHSVGSSGAHSVGCGSRAGHFSRLSGERMKVFSSLRIRLLWNRIYSSLQNASACRRLVGAAISVSMRLDGVVIAPPPPAMQLMSKRSRLASMEQCTTMFSMILDPGSRI